MSRKNRQCSAQKGTGTAPAAFGIVSSVCLPSVIYLSLKLLTWATENSHLKSLLTFISVKDSLHPRSSQPRSSSVGLLLGCQSFKPLGHTCASGQVSSDQIPLPSDGCKAASTKWAAGLIPVPGGQMSMKREEKKKALPLQLIWFSTLVGSLNSEPETEHFGVQRGGKFFSILKASRVVLMHFGRTNWGSSPGCCLFRERKEEFSF